jgi:hypothetical protein
VAVLGVQFVRREVSQLRHAPVVPTTSPMCLRGLEHKLRKEPGLFSFELDHLFKLQCVRCDWHKSNERGGHGTGTQTDV